MTNIWLIASLWVGLALISAMISIRIGISVALIEICAGVLAGNFLHLAPNEWVNFLASIGSVLLTFLAGAEIDPGAMRANLKESLLIGSFSFLAPALGAFATAFWIFKWNLHAAEIAGIALSTTSVAVVYAVMIESGLNETELGKVILAACFVTDLGTVVALGLIFANYNFWLLLFVCAMVFVLWAMPRFTSWYFAEVGNRVSEPEIKFVLFILFLLGGLATLARSEAVLPAYLIGMVMARQFLRNRVLMHRMRAIAFSILTPFYFLKAGSYVLIQSHCGGHTCHRSIFPGEDGYEGMRCFSLHVDIWLWKATGRLHHTAHGHRADVRYNFRSLWADPWLHQPGTIHGSGDRGHFERRPAHVDCGAFLPARPTI